MAWYYFCRRMAVRTLFGLLLVIDPQSGWSVGQSDIPYQMDASRPGLFCDTFARVANPAALIIHVHVYVRRMDMICNYGSPKSLLRIVIGSPSSSPAQ